MTSKHGNVVSTQAGTLCFDMNVDAPNRVDGFSCSGATMSAGQPSPPDHQILKLTISDDADPADASKSPKVQERKSSSKGRDK